MVFFVLSLMNERAYESPFKVLLEEPLRRLWHRILVLDLEGFNLLYLDRVNIFISKIFFPIQTFEELRQVVC